MPKSQGPEDGFAVYLSSSRTVNVSQKIWTPDSVSFQINMCIDIVYHGSLGGVDVGSVNGRRRLGVI